jgi:hypothetical protein
MRRVIAAAATVAALIEAAGPSLIITQTALTLPAQGGTASVRITVTNIGTEASTGFLVIGGVSGASLSTIGGATASCAKGRNSVYTCSLPALSAGTSVDLLESARIDNTATSFTSNATLNGGSDINLTDNRSTLTLAVQGPPPDLQVGGSASTNCPRVGLSYDYKFQVKANGKVPASAVVFSAALQPELQFVGAGTSTGGICDLANGVVTCALGDMVGGSQSTITITVVAPLDPDVTIVTTGSAFAVDGLDAAPSNNTSTVSVTTR